MENSDGKVEFLCLGCGLQGLTEWPAAGPDGCNLCPKCGEYVITSHVLKKEQVKLVHV
ncbi:MAG TPA: hypothetical protein GX699_04285 [Firmicutes bacterium]|nr:hypothetical protein [Bacillota bacterium]